MSCLLFAASLRAENLDELSLDRWKKLREVERYQLQIAERYYRDKNWKVAAAEYEKYLTLYEESEAAAYCQLKWSLTQVNLRKHNTAIKEGFQSVVDYWPESSEAVAAGYYIGNAYKSMGQISKAKRAYQQLLSRNKKHLASVYAIVDLIDITTIEKKPDDRVKLWKQLTFDVPRTRESKSFCIRASQELAAHCFAEVAFDDGVEALTTTYNATQLPDYVVRYAHPQIQRLCAESETKAAGTRLADQLVAYLRDQVPADISSEEGRATAHRYWLHVASTESAALRDDKVEQTYKQMEQKFGSDDAMFAHWANWLKSRDRYDDARAVYRRFEDKIEGLSQVAYSFRQQREFKSAVSTYQQIIAMDPEGANKWLAEIAATHRSVPDYQAAIDTWEQLAKQEIEKAQQWRWQIACAYRDWGKHKEAIAQYQLCDNFPENYKQMAWCHRRLKQPREALALYNQIVGGSPPSAPWAMLQIGYTREEAEQKEEAILAFQKVCKKFPKDQYASVAHAHLQNQYKISVTLGGAKDED